MKGKAFKLITPRRLCLIMVTFFLFSCKNEEGCDTSIVPTWSLSVSCELSHGDTLYIVNTEAFPLCRFSKYKLSFQDEWVDIENSIRLRPNDIRLSGPDFRCSIQMKDNSVQSEMKDFNYLLQPNNSNCKLSQSDNIDANVITEADINQDTYDPEIITNTEVFQEEPILGTGKKDSGIKRIYSNRVSEENGSLEQKIKPEQTDLSPSIKKEKLNPPSRSNYSGPAYTPPKEEDVPPSSYTDQEESKSPNSRPYTPPVISPDKKGPYFTNTKENTVNEPTQKEKPEAVAPIRETPVKPKLNEIESTGSSRNEYSDIRKSPIERPKENEAPLPQTNIDPDVLASVNNEVLPTKNLDKQGEIDLSKKIPSSSVEKQKTKVAVKVAKGSKFSPTKFPTIQFNAACQSSNYESGPISFTMVPKVRMRLNKLTLYSETESLINISISGGYNDFIKNRVLLPTGKSEVGMSGFSAFLEPGKTYTIKLSSSNSEKLKLQDISLCSKDVQEGPYFNISGSALKIISELKIDIE